jgi:hypothetical protein
MAIAALTDAQAEIASLETLEEQVADIVAALRAYLVAAGHPADPITTTDMPDTLAELVKAAGLV